MSEVVTPPAVQNTNKTAEVVAETKTAETAAAATAETKTADPAKTETPPAKSVVPEKYDLKLPEGSQLDASAVEKIASFAKERGLSNEQAQAVLQRDHEAKASFEAANKPGGEDWVKRTADWEKAALADKEIGGSAEALKANAELGRRVLSKFFPESMAKYLTDSGLGSHPDVIRGFVKIGKMMADDQLVVPGKDEGQKKSMAQIFYGGKPNGT